MDFLFAFIRRDGELSRPPQPGNVPPRLSGVVSSLLLSLVIVYFAGCNSSSMEATVTGTVTMNGEPVPLALINFHPDGRGPMPYGVSLKDGSYELKTGSLDGLPPGKYRAVLKSTSGDIGVPEQYGSVATSELDYEVKPGQNVIDIKLE